MNIIFHPKTKTFHLSNDTISYIMTIYRNGHLGQLYYGKRIHDQEDFSYLVEDTHRGMSSSVYAGDTVFSLEHVRQEYPVYGTTDYRTPAFEVLQPTGSRFSNLEYISHEIMDGKPTLNGLPATYTESDSEAKTLIITLIDPVTKLNVRLLYSIFAHGGVLTRSACIVNNGDQDLQITAAMSLCLDLPDKDYEWMQFSGAWAKERSLKERQLEQGITAIDSKRGHSSHDHNPFVILKRPATTEYQGAAIGFSLVYSGNFLLQAEVDAYDNTRILAGINPFGFAWNLTPGETFQTPEAVMVFTENGLNDLSQTYHKLYRERLARGVWRDLARPILINNWEATYFDFTEDKLIEIASKAKECGVELFVLDDGWFGKRCNDRAGLGDWFANLERLPNGVAGISEQVEALGMKFGLWIEPEMVNEDSDLYRAHPDWILRAPDRNPCVGRNQYVLDFSRKEVVNHIYEMIAKIFRESKISYIKWDMNRSITECNSAALSADRQGEVFHRYILGVYDLYERLTTEFPHILFESCSGGGGRFDPGMLYYAPVCWTSDNTDGIERLKIQYGTSMCYPLSSMCSHVSAIPNHQVNRNTPMHTRANVAHFGTFGYELDLNTLSEEELSQVKQQIAFMKEYRELIQFGTFYRLLSPFDGNTTAWMVISEDKKTVLVGWYKVLASANVPYSRLLLQGLDPDTLYLNEHTGRKHYGDELMNLGIITSDNSNGQEKPLDFDSRIYVLKSV